MKFSRFAPLDLYRLSSQKPEAQVIYDSLIANHGGQFAVTSGSHVEGSCFAKSIEIARAQKAQRRALDQVFADTVTHDIDKREREHGIVPVPGSSLAQRREVLAARMRAPEVPTQISIEDELRLMLGDDFVAYRPTPTTDATVWPAAIGDWPMNLQDAAVPRKIIRLLEPVAFVGTEIFVLYETVSVPQDNTAGIYAGPIVGDVFVFDVGAPGLTDRVTITGLGSIGVIGGTFSRAHDAGTLGFTHPLPYWTSDKRYSLIVLTESAAADPQVRRRVNEMMARRARSVSTWAVCAGDATETTGFEIGVPGVGYKTIDTVPLS